MPGLSRERLRAFAVANTSVNQRADNRLVEVDLYRSDDPRFAPVRIGRACRGCVISDRIGHVHETALLR